MLQRSPKNLFHFSRCPAECFSLSFISPTYGYYYIRRRPEEIIQRNQASATWFFQNPQFFNSFTDRCFLWIHKLIFFNSAAWETYFTGLSAQVVGPDRTARGGPLSVSANGSITADTKIILPCFVNFPGLVFNRFFTCSTRCCSFKD